MVRMTIACARCRQLKTKCVHSGQAPCRACSRKGPAESQTCVLREPELKSRSGRSANAARPDAVAHSRHRRPSRQQTPSGQTVLLSSPAPPPGQQQQQQPHQQQRHQQHRQGREGDRGGRDLIASTDLRTALSAVSRFHQKFPELRFLHLPTFTRHLRQAWTNDSRHAARQKLRLLLCAAILALSAPDDDGDENGGGGDDGGDDDDNDARADADADADMARREAYAEYVRGHVALSVFAAPDLLTVQTLVVLSMYEWGMGHVYRAWMYAGAAARMMQSLFVLVKPSTLPAIEQEEYSRTFWSCFVMDRLVFCGRPQPFLLSAYTSLVGWPASEQDYVFGAPPRPPPDGDHAGEDESGGGGGMDHYYGILVRGFDIWARILEFVVRGGRRQAGMCLPENHPWVQGSPWRSLHGELQAWRHSMDKRLRYPETGVEGHAALGHAEPFGYINLIYYISMLFLGREYVPFLPTPGAAPAGPVDPPLLCLPAPQDWWADRSAELFSAAARIVALLADLTHAGAALLDSPFAGFCSFSAATMNLYVFCFPNMNLGRSGPAASMAAVVAENLRFLRRFQRARPMGRGWWVTIQHCRALYEHACRDRELFAGRTRADFEALEYSIHDVRGQPPKAGESLSPSTPLPRQQQKHVAAATASTATAAATTTTTTAATGTEWVLAPPATAPAPPPPPPPPPAAAFAGDFDEGARTAAAVDEESHEHSQIWPLWGEQQTLPFALEGVPLDYHLDMMDVYQ